MSDRLRSGYADLAEAPAVHGDETGLRVQLAAEQTMRIAAEARADDLRARLEVSEQRAARLADELAQANARLADLSASLAATRQIEPPASAEPTAYEGYVSTRDGEGRIKRFEILPKQKGI